MKISHIELNVSIKPNVEDEAPLISLDIWYNNGTRFKSFMVSLSDKQCNDPMAIGQAFADLGRAIQTDAYKRHPNG